jgi:hypothetical protein
MSAQPDGETVMGDPEFPDGKGGRPYRRERRIKEVCHFSPLRIRFLRKF